MSCIWSHWHWFWRAILLQVGSAKQASSKCYVCVFVCFATKLFIWSW